MGIDIDDFASALAKELSDYTLDIAKGVRQATDDVSKEMLANIRSDSPKRKRKSKRKRKNGSTHKKYTSVMALKTEVDNVYELKKRWYVKEPYYRLPHLLENPHKTRNGGRTRAFPHIKKNEEKAQKSFEQKVEGVIENAGK